MDKLSLSVFTLFTFLVPVSCIEGFFAEPVICYFLDGILMVYCVIATVLFFRERFPRKPSVAAGQSVENGIYQELERPKDADPYEVLEPTKRKKKAANKKKSESAKPGEKDFYELLTSPAPPPPPPQSPR